MFAALFRLQSVIATPLKLKGNNPQKRDGKILHCYVNIFVYVSSSVVFVLCSSESSSMSTASETPSSVRSLKCRSFLPTAGRTFTG